MLSKHILCMNLIALESEHSQMTLSMYEKCLGVANFYIDNQQLFNKLVYSTQCVPFVLNKFIF